jgi:hypothetical protein
MLKQVSDRCTQLGQSSPSCSSALAGHAAIHIVVRRWTIHNHGGLHRRLSPASRARSTKILKRDKFVYNATLFGRNRLSLRGAANRS